jgi:hypothetical protein
MLGWIRRWDRKCRKSFTGIELLVLDYELGPSIRGSTLTTGIIITSCPIYTQKRPKHSLVLLKNIFFPRPFTFQFTLYFLRDPALELLEALLDVDFEVDDLF